MKLTPEILKATYEFLRITPPFNRWGLPPGAEIDFRVTKTRKNIGAYHGPLGNGRHMIDISGARVLYIFLLIEIMSHEMIHLHQDIGRTDTPNTQHNAEFQRLAKIVCRHHGYDPNNFC